MNYQYSGPRHSFLVVASIFCLLFGLNEIGQRLFIEVEGIITSSKTTTGNRATTTYVLKSTDGKTVQYVAGPTDYSLKRGLQEGTYIKKRKYELSWQKNDEIINDFPLTYYLGACSLGLILAYWGFIQWRLNRSRMA